MKKFMLIHVGFEQPTPEIMGAWKAWFASIADRQVDQGGFAGGRELTDEGSKDLPWGPDCFTGYNLSLIHISEPTRRRDSSRMPSSA